MALLRAPSPLLLGSALAGLLLSKTALAEPWEVRPSAEAGVGRDLVGATSHAFVGAALDLPVLARRFELGAGMRLLTGGIEPEPVFSGFLSARVCARHGMWSPAVGLELELSTAHRAETPDEPPDSFTRAFNAAGRDEVLRAHLLLEPLRLAWKQLSVAAGSVRLGTPLDGDAGQRVRLSVTLLRLGWAVSL